MMVANTIHMNWESLSNAHQGFLQSSFKTENSWIPLIQGHIEHGKFQLALELLRQIQEDCLHISKPSLQILLKACARLKCMEQGQKAHAMAVWKNYEADPFLGSTIVDMYAKFGSYLEAEQVFYALPSRDVVLWTTLITGYMEHGHCEDALKCLERMEMDGVSPNAFTFASGLKSCGTSRRLTSAHKLHSKIVMKEFERDSFVGNALVDSYAKCGSLIEAQQVFDCLLVRNVVSWTALISGYVEQGLAEEAINCLEKMQFESGSLDSGIFVCSLKACGSTKAISKGQELHIEIAKEGFERNCYVGSALVNMYAKCRLLAEAQEVFDELPARDIITWTALVTGYVEVALAEEALSCLEKMQLDGVVPNAVTYAGCLKACALGASYWGQDLHMRIVNVGYDLDPCVGNSLVVVYANCGLLLEAQQVFNELRVRDVASWNAIIHAYAQQGVFEKALYCKKEMQLEGVSPDLVTYIHSLQACGSIGVPCRGEELYIEIIVEGFENDHVIKNALIDMYSKCGLLAEAQDTFDDLPDPDVISWSAGIQGYAFYGNETIAFYFFEQLTAEGMCVDGILGMNLLSVCCHSGLLDEGMMCYAALVKMYALAPAIEIENCMVDLFGRAGDLDAAVAVLRSMPFQPDGVMWITLLDACRKRGMAELAIESFADALKRNEGRSSTFVLLSNMFACSEEIKVLCPSGSDQWIESCFSFCNY